MLHKTPTMVVEYPHQIDVDLLLLSMEGMSFHGQNEHGQYVYNNSNYGYSHNNYGHSSDYSSCGYSDGFNTSIYIRGPQLLRESDEDLDSKSLYYLHFLEHPYLNGTWFDLRHPPNRLMDDMLLIMSGILNL